MAERGDDGRWHPVVTDFGLARETGQSRGLTESGAVIGTPSYMSPEQARGEVRSLDRRTDIYNLGATLYDLVSGAPPFEDQSIVSVLFKVLYHDPPALRVRLPSIPADLETITLKCLNKEPGQRYQTALMLAQDLQRYINGEPILGRRTGWWYRLIRQARRNRALVAVSLLSLMSIMALAGYGLHLQVRAQRELKRTAAQALLAQQLGRDMKDIEWLLRSAYQLPLHDISREQKLTRARMAEIAERQRALDPADIGFIHYALGRGHLALHELEAAQAQLTLARDKGVDLPELHYALGRVLGELYQKGLEQARRSGDRGWLASRQKQLEQEYLEPALAQLERSRSAKLESPEFLEGLIAFYRKQHGIALAKAQRSAAESPWLYEAWQLQGDVYLEQATEQRDRGEYEAAQANLGSAVTLYGLAADIGRSDASIYDALAEAWIQQSQIESDQRKSPQAALDRALLFCEKANTAAPSDAAGYTKKAYSHFWLAWDKLVSGKDPRPEVERLVAAGSRAVLLRPTDEYAYDAIGNGYWIRGNYERDQGGDPTESWRKATENLQKAIAVAPTFPWPFNDLGLVYQERGRYLESKGQDAAAEHAQAISYFRKAIEIYPQGSSSYNNIIIAYGLIAQHDCLRGSDPSPAVKRAAQEAERALARNSNIAEIHVNIALARAQEARYLLDAGRDPSAAALAAQGSLEQALAKNPKDPLALYWQCVLMQLMAAYKVSQGLDPAEYLKKGDAGVRLILEQDAADREGNLLQARFRQLEARWAARRGAPVLPILESALAAARRADAAQSASADAVEELARVTLRLAEQARPQAAPVQLAMGQALAERALFRNPELAQGHALRGAFLLLAAEQAAGQAERMELRQKGREAFRRALSINPLLRREYEPYLKRAQMPPPAPQ